MTLKFSIQNLLEKKKDDNIAGSMAPLLFAQEMAQRSGFEFNRLARVCFGDKRIHQVWEKGKFTRYDTLIIGFQDSTKSWLGMWVDCGTGVFGAIPVATSYQSGRDTIITPVYLRDFFILNLSGEQIAEIFDHIFRNPDVFAIETEKN